MSESFVSVRDLVKIYKMGDTEVHALNGVSLEIERGTFNVLMGPSGSGKSTLLYMIGGLDWPTSGSILVDGDQIDQMDENRLANYRRDKLGFIFQSFNLVSSMTAEANIGFPLRFSGVKKSERAQRANDLMAQVGLEDRIGHKPTELSGGQQQRVAVARSLVNDPPLILADEPTGNLDTQSGIVIMQLLEQLCKSGKTIIVASHDPRMLNYATHRINLLDGQLVSDAQYQESLQQLG